MLTVFDRPICALCKRPVEKMTRWENPGRHLATYVVECHGAAEETVLTYEQMARAGRGGIQFGLAFNAQALPDQIKVPLEGGKAVRS